MRKKKNKERKHTSEEDAMIKKALKIPGSVLLLLSYPKLDSTKNDNSIDWSDIEEKTKQMLERQEKCPHLYKISKPLVIPGLMIQGIGVTDYSYRLLWYCVQCGKNL